MEKKNIYIILLFLLFVALSFSVGYYFGIRNGVYETEKSYEKILNLDEINKIENKIDEIEEKIIINSGKIENKLNEKNNKKEEKIVEKNGTGDKRVSSGVFLEEKNEEEKKIASFGFDFSADYSLQKFVNSEIPFSDKKYVPKKLQKISSDFVLDLKGGNQVLRAEANNALQKMGEKFLQENNEKIKVVSAYRSYDYQVGIKKGGCPDSLCAKAGFSEHQTGLVVDLWSASSEKTWKNDISLQKYFSWLNENAHNFGFHNTYQKGLEIDGYVVEPWHWRYVGVELATYLKNNNLTIAEYYKSL